MAITKQSWKKFADSVAELDARKDEHLKDYLVQTNIYRKILEDPRSIDLLVGLKGSGKSSLYNTLSTTPTSAAPAQKVIKIGISPENATWDVESGKTNILQFAESAQKGLAIYILRHLSENVDTLPEKIAIRKEILKPFSALSSFAKSFQGFSIFGCGISFKAFDRKTGSMIEPISKKDTEAAVELLKKFTSRGFKIEVTTDDADRVFGGEEPDKHLLAGFILGSSDLKKQVEGLSVVHILKSHVKESLSSIEEFTNRPKRSIQYIAWSTDELLDLIVKRLRFSGLAWTDVFDFSETEYVKYFEFKLRNGPRDILRHLDVVLDNVNTIRKLQLSDFGASENDYKSFSFQQMQVVYGDVFKDIGDFVRELFKRRTELDFSKFSDEYEKMRLESRPTAETYKTKPFANHKEAFRSMTESGCIDLFNGSTWIPPYRAEYYNTLLSGAANKMRANFAIRY